MLTLSPDVDAGDIKVTVKEGVVTLNGTVESRQAKRMAELEIENISGVMDVQNYLAFERSSPPVPKNIFENQEEGRH
ncbi:MAG TPA: BON domain-containing protein [Bacteriovoracaceae bacterium]|nr:BON domain-containing protein [Bacteriovoracaceae bacterium]